MTKKLAIFDIDGTLHKTEVMSTAAYGEVMPRMGLPVPGRETILATFGTTTPEIIRRMGIPSGREEEFVRELRAEELVQMRGCGKCYDGALAMLRRLHDEGCLIALCSMCDKGYMETFIDHFGLADIVAAERNETDGDKKSELLRDIMEEIRPDKAVMAGDRVFDIEAARANGIYSIGCLYGYAPEEAKAADAVASTVSELYEKIIAAFK